MTVPGLPDARILEILPTKRPPVQGGVMCMRDWGVVTSVNRQPFRQCFALPPPLAQGRLSIRKNVYVIDPQRKGPLVRGALIRQYNIIFWEWHG